MKKLFRKIKRTLRKVLSGQREKILLAALFIIVFAFFAGMSAEKAKTKSAETLSRKAEVNKAVVKTEMTKEPEVTEKPVQKADLEKEIYTFLQGPKSWDKRLQWSGEWGVTHYDGGSFGGFGCGLCCIANVYSSLTKYQCTPVDAYRYAKKNTEYSGGGAIDWGYMRQSLALLGFDCGVKKKPDSYKKFQEEIAASQSAIVLVTSAESKCYWKNTPGHYVTVFLYNPENDKVFLADSGDPQHNRHWVPLRKIYKSLKTVSPWQYLLVGDYDEKQDQWHHKKAEGNWVK